jgi:ABC-type branched-subunit amino acid transport system substrate-binding protein
MLFKTKTVCQAIALALIAMGAAGAEDDGGDPKQATAAAQKLVDASVNGVVGHETSGTTIPASKIYYDAGIPQITPSSTNPKYTLQGFNTTFRVVANDIQLGRAWAAMPSRPWPPNASP